MNEIRERVTSNFGWFFEFWKRNSSHVLRSVFTWLTIANLSWTLGTIFRQSDGSKSMRNVFLSDSLVELWIACSIACSVSLQDCCWGQLLRTWKHSCFTHLGLYSPVSPGVFHTRPPHCEHGRFSCCGRNRSTSTHSSCCKKRQKQDCRPYCGTDSFGDLLEHCEFCRRADVAVAPSAFAKPTKLRTTHWAGHVIASLDCGLSWGCHHQMLLVFAFLTWFFWISFLQFGHDLMSLEKIKLTRVRRSSSSCFRLTGQEKWSFDWRHQGHVDLQISHWNFVHPSLTSMNPPFEHVELEHLRKSPWANRNLRMIKVWALLSVVPTIWEMRSQLSHASQFSIGHFTSYGDTLNGSMCFKKYLKNEFWLTFRERIVFYMKFERIRKTTAANSACTRMLIVSKVFSRLNHIQTNSTKIFWFEEFRVSEKKKKKRDRRERESD